MILRIRDHEQALPRTFSLESYGNALPPATATRYTREVDVLLVVCHPSEQSFSFALAAAVETAARTAGASVTRHNLYQENFDPVLRAPELARRYSFEPLVQRHMVELRACTRLVVVHPDWWGGPPALLKGWIDRVFRPGTVYEWEGEEFGEKHSRPLLTGTAAAVFIPSDRPRERPVGSLESFWGDVFGFAGIAPATVDVFPDVRNSSARERRGWLSRVEKRVRAAGSLSPRGLEL